MSNPSSPTLDEVVENIVEEVLRERVEQQKNRETIPEEVGQETEEIEVEIEAGDARGFYSDRGVEAYKKHLMKKGFVEEREFKKLVAPFKEEIERRGWEIMS